eukprot:TRINITY_DN6705_c0_g2_i1.p1 TRINITY_DN6705_c0_g2~~TRINITY_DN6705_c0_g2_i1.p1  ORF type:complete len:187 (+),score=33.08 TRINITY_DN6705_c0_g2_i1:132-692(+)
MRSPERSLSRPDPLQRTKEEREAGVADDLGPASGSSAEADDEEEYEVTTNQAGASRPQSRAREPRWLQSVASAWQTMVFGVLVVVCILIVGLAILNARDAGPQQPAQPMPPDVTQQASFLHQTNQVMRSERLEHRGKINARLSQLGVSFHHMRNKRKLGSSRAAGALVGNENAAIAIMHTGQLQPG